jgi:hypothetical protein
VSLSPTRDARRIGVPSRTLLAVIVLDGWRKCCSWLLPLLWVLGLGLSSWFHGLEEVSCSCTLHNGFFSQLCEPHQGAAVRWRRLKNPQPAPTPAWRASSEIGPLTHQRKVVLKRPPQKAVWLSHAGLQAIPIAHQLPHPQKVQRLAAQLRQRHR